jgi:hypothetical protein
MQEKKNIARALARVYSEVAAIYDRMSVLSSGIVCDFFFLKHPTPLNNPTEIHHKGLSPVRLVATKIFAQITQDTSSTGISPRKGHEESEVRHCWCEVWRHHVETRLNFLNATSHQERQNSITQQAEADIKNDCTNDVTYWLLKVHCLPKYSPVL